VYSPGAPPGVNSWQMQQQPYTTRPTSGNRSGSSSCNGNLNSPDTPLGANGSQTQQQQQAVTPAGSVSRASSSSHAGAPANASLSLSRSQSWASVGEMVYAGCCCIPAAVCGLLFAVGLGLYAAGETLWWYCSPNRAHMSRLSDNLALVGCGVDPSWRPRQPRSPVQGSHAQVLNVLQDLLEIDECYPALSMLRHMCATVGESCKEP
jgi:hypothetical protein